MVHVSYVPKNALPTYPSQKRIKLPLDFSVSRYSLTREGHRIHDLYHGSGSRSDPSAGAARGAFVEARADASYGVRLPCHQHQKPAFESHRLIRFQTRSPLSIKR